MADSEFKNYSEPEWTNNTSLSEPIVKWFKDVRGISQRTLLDLKITEETKYIEGSQRNCISFNYFDGDALVNQKYRTGDKRFGAPSNCRKIWYNINSIKNSDEVVIVEGEMDVLSMHEAGILNSISVPNGAQSLTDELISEYSSVFEDVKRIVIAVDGDSKGAQLASEISRRFGPERCARVSWPEGCKDANDVLVNAGKLELASIIEEAPMIPVEGIVYAKDILERGLLLFENGFQRGDVLGDSWVTWDSCFSFTTKMLTIITGVPEHGKSEFIETILLKYATGESGIKVGIFTPEHDLTHHLNKISMKVIGKTMSSSSDNKMEKSEYIEATSWLNDNVFYVEPSKGQTDVDYLIAQMKVLVYRHGIKAFLIDPWNYTNAGSGPSAFEKIQETLVKLNLAKKTLDIHIFVVAHPRKMTLKEDGTYYKPGLYDVAGSSDFYNMADWGMTVYRIKDDESGTDVTEVTITKRKYSHLADGARECRFYLNENNKRFYPALGGIDNSNWLAPKETSTPKQMDIVSSVPNSINEEPFGPTVDDVPF